MMQNFVYFSNLNRKDKWIEVLKVGSFDQGDGGFEITADNLHEAVVVADRKFFQHGQKIPVFVGHKVMYNFQARTEEELSGEIDELKVDGDKLLAHVDFVDDMAQKIRDKKFRGASAEFTTNLRDETGETLGFGLTAVGMTNVPFLGLKPISLSVSAAQEDSMTTATEQRLMVLTGAQTPESACAQVEKLQGENRTLTSKVSTLESENASQKQRLHLAEQARDNQAALTIINKAIGENKPVAGMVQGFDEAPSDANPFPALKALTVFGGIAGAEHVFSTVAPLANTAKGVDHAPGDPEDLVQDKSDEIDGIPQKALTVAQARQHFCTKLDIPAEKYETQRRYFSNLSELDFLQHEGYIIVSEQSGAKE